MDRSKVIGLLLLGFLLLAGGTLLLDRDQAPASAPPRVTATAQQQTEKRSDTAHNHEPALAPVVAAASSSAPPLAADAFRGTVIDAVTREPVKEFEIQLTRVRVMNANGTTQDAPIARKFQAPTGRFSWSGAASGTWRALVSAAGYQVFNVDEFTLAKGRPTPDLIVPLLRGFKISGRVSDRATGAVIADATITFREKDRADDFRRVRAHAKSAKDGSFTLDGIPGGEILLVAYARDRASHELALLVDGKNPPVEIALSAGGRIAGMVTTTAGVPVAGRIFLRGGNPAYVSKTDDAGQFSFDHLRPGRYIVAANTSAGSAQHTVVLHEDEINDGIQLIVGSGRNVLGTVRGRRLEEPSQTYLSLRTESGLSFSAHPDEYGAYVIKGVPPGPAVVSLFDRGLSLQKSVDVPSDRDVTLDFALPAGARLSGRVRLGKDAAASRTIWMGLANGPSDTHFQAQTSTDGSYAIDGLPSGEYRLRIDQDFSRTVTIAGDMVLNIDIPAAQISARVVEEGSVPIIGANVFLRGSAADNAGDKQTNDFGEFSLTGVETGEVVLIVYKPGYAMHMETISYSAPIANRTITLRKDTGVEVRVAPASRRFPRGFTLTHVLPGKERSVDLWIPLDSERVGRIPSALRGTTLQIGRFSGSPIVMQDWDGTSFDLP